MSFGKCNKKRKPQKGREKVGECKSKKSVVKYMKVENALAIEMDLDEYLKRNQKYYRGSAMKMSLFLLKKILEYHPYEGLVLFDEESGLSRITPRGIDYFQSVILMYEKENLFAIKQLSKEEQLKIFEKLDMEWTDKWVRFLSSDAKTIDDFIEEKDMYLKDFAKLYDIKMNLLRVHRKRIPKTKEYLCREKNGYSIKSYNVKKFLIEFYCSYLIKNVSYWIAKKQKSPNKIYEWIRIQEFSELEEKKYAIKSIAKKKGIKIENTSNLISFESKLLPNMSVADLKMIKECLQQCHPHETMIYKEWNTEKSDVGNLFFTIHGAEWYSMVYAPCVKNKEGILNGSRLRTDYENDFMMRCLRAANIDLEEGLSKDINQMMEIYLFSNEEALKITMRNVGVEKCVEDLTEDDFRLLESVLPICRLRRFSWLYSKTKRYKDEIVEYVPIKNEKKENREWLEIDSSPNGWYYGRIINKPYYTGKGVREILVLPIKLENGKKIKMRLPMKALKDEAIVLLFLHAMPIRFETESIWINDEEHHRVRQFVIGKQIGLFVDWKEKSTMYYVPIPQVGGTKKQREENLSYLKEEFRNQKVATRKNNSNPNRMKEKIMRNKNINFRCTDEEYAFYKNYAKEHNLDLSQSIRSLTLPQRLTEDDVLTVIEILAKIKSEINENVKDVEKNKSILNSIQDILIILQKEE